ncbi:MAG: OmpA family protein [Gemmatimonadota bacterium]|nr:OmpA family protein [Gemmatimonadota bacterium]
MGTAARDNKRKIIVIKKKVKGHGGHHGGSWKVAYADFVTAMMAFFMVMWILGMDQKLKNAVEGYFSNPIGYKKGYSGGKSPLSSGSSPASVQMSQSIRLASRAFQERQFDEVSGKLKAKLKEQSNGLGGLGAQVEIVVTDAGLRIELLEAEKGDHFFSSGSAVMRPRAQRALEMIAEELIALDNPLVIEGHTDSAPLDSAGYSNFELSVDRANAARRLLVNKGVKPTRIEEVRGWADRQLRDQDNPLNPSNRRISIFLPFVVPLSVADMPEAPKVVAPPATPLPKG